MEIHRRRTDDLATAPLPNSALQRASAACEGLVEAGFDSAFAVQLPAGGPGDVSVCAATGRVEPFIEAGIDVARRALERGRAVETVDADDRHGKRWCLAAIPCGMVGGEAVVIVVVDRRLSRRECEAIATWVSAVETTPYVERVACGDLVHELTDFHNADVAVVALFAQAGMLLNLHTRDGALLRSWRVPVDTVWGEAARHNAAYVLGDLHMHPGAECLASVGMRAAAIVGVENGSGVAVGSVGVGSYSALDLDVAHALLAQAPELGPRIMALKSSTNVPVPSEVGDVQLKGFAARVGCRRFALYAKTGDMLRLVSAHAADGSMLIAGPDPFEEQLVCWAAEKGVAVSSEDAAAIVLGDDTVLYAQDPAKRAIECLRLALQDLRHNPYGQQAA